MRRLLAALLLALAFSGPAHALSKVWGDSYDGFDSAGNTTDDAVNSAGYEYAVAYACNDTPGTTITFSDSVSSSDITYFAQTAASANVTGRMALIKLASTSASYTVTATHSGSPTFRNVGFWLIDSSTGLVTTDASAFAASSSPSTAPDAGTLSTTGASAVAFLAVCVNASGSNTESSGWTEDVDGSENFGVRNIAASRGPETTTPIDPAYTTSSTDWSALSSAFREASAPSSALLLRRRRN